MKVLGFGAILWDNIKEDSGTINSNSVVGEKNIGGSVFNVIVHLKKLGYGAYMLSAVGDDKLGKKTFEEIDRLGIHKDFIGTSEAPTCLVEVSFDKEGSPHYSCPDIVSWDQIKEKNKAEKINDLNFDLFVFGTLEQRNIISRNTLHNILENVHFKNVYTDLTLRGGFYDKNILGYSMRKANIVKMNDDEAFVVNKLFEFKQTDVQKLIRIIAREFNCDIVCITSGSRGAYIGDRSTTVYKPAYKITVKDTVGSGDAFSAGLLYMLDNGASIGEACNFGNKMGALISSKRSSIPDYDISEIGNIMNS